MMASGLGDESVVSAADTSPEAFDFCVSKGIVSELGAAIDSAQRHFPIIGNPSVGLVQHPEVEGMSYLVIEIQVSGTVRDNVLCRRRY